MLSGLFRYGMARSFQKNHHPNANLKIHQTQKAGPVIKPFGETGMECSCGNQRKYCSCIRAGRCAFDSPVVAVLSLPATHYLPLGGQMGGYG